MGSNELSGGELLVDEANRRILAASGAEVKSSRKIADCPVIRLSRNLFDEFFRINKSVPTSFWH
jgi:hypothetical protein